MKISESTIDALRRLHPEQPEQDETCMSVDFKVYVIQARGDRDYWYTVAAWAVPGYKRWDKHPDRMTGTHGDRSYSDCLAFSNIETALQALWYARIDPCHSHPYGGNFGNRETGLIERRVYRAVERHVVIKEREIADESTVDANT